MPKAYQNSQFSILNLIRYGTKTKHTKGNKGFFARRDDQAKLYVRHHQERFPHLRLRPTRNPRNGEPVDSDGQVWRGGRQTALQDTQLGQLSGEGYPRAD